MPADFPEELNPDKGALAGQAYNVEFTCAKLANGVGLKKGWNHIEWDCEDVEFKVGFASILSNVEVIYHGSKLGKFYYIPVGSKFIKYRSNFQTWGYTDLQTLVKGRVYTTYLNSATTLTYPTGCTPKECNWQEYAGGIRECGTVDDGCGGTIDCGDKCSATNEVCGAETQNQCGGCKEGTYQLSDDAMSVQVCSRGQWVAASCSAENPCTSIAATACTTGVSCPGNVDVPAVGCPTGQSCQEGSCVQSCKEIYEARCDGNIYVNGTKNSCTNSFTETGRNDCSSQTDWATGMSKVCKESSGKTDCAVDCTIKDNVYICSLVPDGSHKYVKNECATSSWQLAYWKEIGPDALNTCPSGETCYDPRNKCE